MGKCIAPVACYLPLTTLLLIILLAFGLRVYELDGQSMWSDEGLSVYRAGLDLAGVLGNEIVVDGVETRDTNPPFYFLLLNLWRRAAGDEVFMLRYLSVVAGVLATPLMYLLGRVVYGPALGLAGALLWAISPLDVWMSQELRNYSLLLLLNVLSVYGLFRYLFRITQRCKGAKIGRGGEELAADERGWARRFSGSSRGWLLLWGGAGLLGVYTHYFGFFVLAYGGAALLAAFAWRRWRPRPGVVVVGVLLLLVALPVAAGALERFRAGRQVDYDFVPVAHVVQHGLDAFAVGMSATLRHPAGRVWPVVVLAAAGAALLLWRRRGLAPALVAGYLVLPLSLLLLLSQINPLYNGPRHLLFALPPFLLLVGMGVVGWPGRWRIVGLAGGLFVLVSQGQWLGVQYHDAALRKDDVRGAALYLNEHARPGDVIVLHDTLIQFTFGHYYEGAAPVVGVPSLGEQDVTRATGALQAAGAGAERVWFLAQPTPRTGFPRETLWEWAEAEWPRFLDRPFAGLWLHVRLLGYTPDPVVAGLPAGAQSLEERFGEAVALHGVVLPAEVTAGETAWLELYLSRLEPAGGDYTVSLRFTDEAGNVWEQVDGLLWRRYPPNVWPEGAMLRYDHELELPAGLPPGEYQVQMRLLGPDLEPLPAGGGVDVALGRMEVLAGRDVGALPPFTAQRARLGPVTLLGYSLPATEIRPGHVVPLDLFWEVRERPAIDYGLRVQLLDAAGAVIAERVGAPVRDGYPPTAWQAGEVLRGRAAFVLPGTVEPGSYRVRLALVEPDGEGRAGREVTLGQEVVVVAWPLVTALPEMPQPLRADFGEPVVIELHGYGLSGGEMRPGETLAVTLFWRAAEAPATNYQVFIHLVDEAGEIVAQDDSAPVQGVRPTAGWRPGEVVVDEHVLAIPAKVAAGSYQLWVGLYEPDSGMRLPVYVGGMVQGDGRLLLQRLEVGR